MRHKYPYIIVILVLVASIYLVIFSNNPPPSPESPTSPSVSITETPIPTNYSASFLIFTNGTKRIFTGSMYHNLSPDVFIQNPNPAIIQVKKADTTWKDFFSTLPMGLTATCLVTGTGQTFCNDQQQSSTSARLHFILNGNENPEVLDEVIQPEDKLLISFGRLTNTQLQLQYDQIPTATPSSQIQEEE